MSQTEDNTDNNDNQIMQYSIEKSELHENSCVSKNSLLPMNTKSKSNFDDVTEQILFCQNGSDLLNISSQKNKSILVSQS